jgi:putative polyhydroxyalkanoate system protein
VADIRIVREHSLPPAQARQLALRWAELARKKLEMECSYEEGEGGEGGDLLRFRRSGARGELRVAPGRFELNVHLGLLLGMFRSRIEAEIVKNFDALMAEDDPLAAFEAGLAQHEARRQAKAEARQPKAQSTRPKAK